MSRRTTSERDSAYNRDDRSDRRERDTRNSVQRDRDVASRTPERATAEIRPTLVDSRNVTAIDPRSTAQSRTVAESRDARAVVDRRSTRDPRDTAYSRHTTMAVDNNDLRPADIERDLLRDSRTAPPVVTSNRDTRRPEDIPPRGPRNEYFLPGEDISREVITADICRYLGPDALVRPYRHQDGRNGYIITAYRALTTPMITTLKHDSLKFEADNRRRINAGHRPQAYAQATQAGQAAYDQTSRFDPYGDDRNAPPMSRVDSRYGSELEPRRSRNHNPLYDEMELDDPMDSRDTRYARDLYDSREPRARPQMPPNYGQPGRDLYAYDTRSEPRLDERVDTRMDPRVDPRVDPRGYAQATVPADRDYRMGDGRTAYGDPRAAQPAYAPTRHEQFGALPQNQPGAIPRSGRDEPQVYIDQRTGQPVIAAPRTDVRHAPTSRSDRMDFDPRGYR